MRSRAAHLRPSQVTIYPPAPSGTVFLVIEVHSWLEREVAERRANIGQAERGVIDHNVAAALGAIPAVAQLAGVELTEKLLALIFTVSGFHNLKKANQEGRKTGNIMNQAK